MTIFVTDTVFQVPARPCSLRLLRANSLSQDHGCDAVQDCLFVNNSASYGAAVYYQHDVTSMPRPPAGGLTKFTRCTFEGGAALEAGEPCFSGS